MKFFLKLLSEFLKELSCVVPFGTPFVNPHHQTSDRWSRQAIETSTEDVSASMIGSKQKKQLAKVLLASKVLFSAAISLSMSSTLMAQPGSIAQHRPGPNAMDRKPMPTTNHNRPESRRDNPIMNNAVHQRNPIPGPTPNWGRDTAPNQAPPRNALPNMKRESHGMGNDSRFNDHRNGHPNSRDAHFDGPRSSSHRPHDPRLNEPRNPNPTLPPHNPNAHGFFTHPGNPQSNYYSPASYPVAAGGIPQSPNAPFTQNVSYVTVMPQQPTYDTTYAQQSSDQDKPLGRRILSNILHEVAYEL